MTEDQAVAALKKLAKRWPKTLWLWSASGSLHVMRLQDGTRAMNDVGGVDDHYRLASIEIPNDGGDW